MSHPPKETPPSPFDDEPNDDIPLHQKRPFGSGLYKQRITFVPASSPLQTVNNDAPTTGNNIADLYLSMVLPPSPPSKPPHPLEDNNNNPNQEPPSPLPPPLCPTCHLPILPNHTLSLPHQLSLPHSHPPSSLDRSRMGLQYLSSQGWDPDARRGLGSTQQGIQFPIKPKPKDDRFGLGVEMVQPTTKDLKGKLIPLPPPPPKEKKKLLDAKKVRKQYEQEKKKKARIMAELNGNGNDKLDKYLGSGAA